ncbi:DUF547 domain-containing protein [Polaribacter sp. MSW13]|uniref:DUF547 domain-containing protein n=1 Tax=Polaribacter marinus TaxID=2916838 RepID=A0A9X2AL48_9FLAO|nr:DUF547 domain-containing protein [Polaribacter marinus]MCI2230203.1 DUF547 domain-containing protein [Polaribacter marinus]
MKKTLLLFITILTVLKINAQTSVFNNLLQKNVDKNGVVDYQLLKQDITQFNRYISYLEKTSPNKYWSTNKQKAFWINVYNAYTIKIILDNYPLKSITVIKKEGKTAWKIPFVKVGGKTYTLDYIEHEILFKNFFDPRIHVGVNCASKSCPKLANIAFTENNIDAELTKLMNDFVNDTSKNKISEKKIQVSEIFNWFNVHFTKNGSVIDFLNTYSETKINPNAEITYLKYNWTLNGK